MKTRIVTVILSGAAWAGLLAAQKQLSLPGGPAGRLVNSGAPQPAVVSDMVSRYHDPRQAAIAALQAGNDAATITRAPERAMGLFMLATRRDPAFATPVYNLGVSCASQERWDDALSFYREAQLLDRSPEMGRMTNDEIERVQMIARLESSPDGKRTRQFDISFMALMGRLKNPIMALEEASQLAKTDAGRWEAPAVIGMLQASEGKYDESARALESAIKLAPADRRQALTTAAEIARREATFEDLLRAADDNWTKQQYDLAGKAYANAWETSPARETVGMQAATAFLMADEVSLAAQVLAKLGQSGSPQISQKAVAMLKELGAVSADAKNMAAAGYAGSTQASMPDVGERVRTVLGDLTSPEMRLAAKSAPPFLRDETKFIHVPDEELISNKGDLLLISTQSAFQIYRRGIPQDSLQSAAPSDFSPAAAPGPDSIPANSAPASPAPEATPLPGHPPKFGNGLAPAPSTTPAPHPQQGASASINSSPAGANIVLDDNAAGQCVSPCSLALDPGRHTLHATLNGYREIRKVFEIPKGRAFEIDLPFERRQGTVFVDSKTPGARIVVDGQTTDKAVPAQLVLAEGPHRVGVLVSGNTQVKDIEVRDEDLLRLSF